MTIERKEVRLEDILLDEGTQARDAEDEKAISEYAQAMEQGETFPPAVLFKGEGSNHCIGDGNHRIRAAKSIGRKVILAEVHSSNDPFGDARFYSCGANVSHGVRLTNADKRRAIDLILKDPDRREMPARQIAKHVGCSHALVNKVKRSQQGGNISTQDIENPAINSEYIEIVTEFIQEHGVISFAPTDTYKPWLKSVLTEIYKEEKQLLPAIFRIIEANTGGVTSS